MTARKRISLPTKPNIGGMPVSESMTIANDAASHGRREPSPRIDAVRGCVAIERGPIVYCVEQADLGTRAILSDVALAKDAAPTDGGPVAPLGGVPGVSVAGVVSDLDAWTQTEYADVRDLPRDGSAAPTPLLAIPYFTWANRGDAAMRVWLPRSD